VDELSEKFVRNTGEIFAWHFIVIHIRDKNDPAAQSSAAQTRMNPSFTRMLLISMKNSFRSKNSQRRKYCYRKVTYRLCS
jgi:hypothetical protein